VLKPTLEKSSKFILEFLEEGESTRLLGLEDKNCEFLDWYDFQIELASTLEEAEELYLIELPTSIE